MQDRGVNTPWWAPVVAGGAVLGLALGARHVQGLLLLPMSSGRGWSREGIALAFAVQNLVWGAAQPLAGWWADRHGSARVLLLGALLYAAALVGVATAPSVAVLFCFAGIVQGLALACTGFGVVYAAIGRLVAADRRGQALGLAGAIGGLGQFVLVPLVQQTIERHGWIAAVLGLAALLALSASGTPQLDDRAASRTSPSADQTAHQAIAQALRQPRFWWLNLGFTACGFQLALIATHLPGHLLQEGVPARVAAAGIAVIALANVPGTYGLGRLGDRFARKRVLSLLYLLRSAALALFLIVPAGEASTLAFCIAMGLLWLGTVPLTSGLLAQMFGVRWLGLLFGLVFIGHQVGAFFGVWLGAWVVERFGSYEPMWIVALLLGLLAAVLHWPLDDRPVTAGRWVPS
jgi:MFS family permease